MEETAEEPELLSGPATVSELSADNEVALELALWDSVKEGSPAELESYLEQYPEGTFASLARTRIDAALHSMPERAAPATAEPAADEVALELALWDSVKEGSPAELESYLEQYPEGTFASLARTRIDAALHSTVDPAMEATAEAAADPLDLAFWESVKDSNRCEELQAYLDQHPTGHFAGLARARLASPDVT